ncbi:MAG: histidine phosphatase family protein [Actinomycetota bacterium]|nr:histidine phosphatase family protein [Actinomycetota bacterium]
MTTPVRYLYLLRHAKSDWDDPGLEDHERPLSPRGRKAAKKIAQHLRESGIQPSLVLCSSALRARQTLEGVSSAFGEAVAIKVERSLYGADEGNLLARLRRVPASVQSVMVIGHNPGLQFLALTLAARGKQRARLEAKFPTAALATLRILESPWKELDRGRAELVELVVPRDLG